MMPQKSVYVVQAAIGVIKIGCSYQPHQRARMISAHSPAPVRLIAVIDGDGKAERSFHERFAAHRSHNEWFREEGEVVDFIREVFGQGLPEVLSWADCDRSLSSERAALRRASASATAKARWADPAFRTKQAEYRARRNAIRGAA